MIGATEGQRTCRPRLNGWTTCPGPSVAPRAGVFFLASGIKSGSEKAPNLFWGRSVPNVIYYDITPDGRFPHVVKHPEISVHKDVPTLPGPHSVYFDICVRAESASAARERLRSPLLGTNIAAVPLGFCSLAGSTELIPQWQTELEEPDGPMIMTRSSLMVATTTPPSAVWLFALGAGPTLSDLAADHSVLKSRSFTVASS
ncbi:hypothetical protein DFP91_5807 [Pseudorhodoplanes sinuspersici]|nr:hypothetical protein DFP91_5807 [Pseudorhodoplanes sinuspersici]